MVFAIAALFCGVLGRPCRDGLFPGQHPDGKCPRSLDDILDSLEERLERLGRSQHHDHDHHGHDHGPISKGCGKEPDDFSKGKLIQKALNVQGADRRFQVFVPTNYDDHEPHMIIYSAHGFYGTGWGQDKGTHWTKTCEEKNCIVVLPNGYEGNELDAFDWREGWESPLLEKYGVPGWNSGGSGKGFSLGKDGTIQPVCDTASEYLAECPANCGGDCNPCQWGSCSDDVRLYEMMMDYMEAKLCIDLDRVYVDGFSNGGMLTWSITRSRLVSRIAAAAMTASSPHLGFSTEPKLGPFYLSVLDTHGSVDDTIPANATQAGADHTSDGSYYYTPTDVTLAKYGAANGCTKIDEIVEYDNKLAASGTVWCRKMFECGEGVDVIRCSHGGGHEFPHTDTISYADYIYDFYESHPRKRKGKVKHHYHEVHDGKCQTLKGSDPKYHYSGGSNPHACESACDKNPKCGGFSASIYGACLLWLDSPSNLKGHGDDWGGASCHIKA